MRVVKGKAASASGIRLVALFEGAKGLLVLLVGFGLLELIHKDLHRAAEQIVRNMHLNPARHYPMVLIDALNNLTDSQLLALALSALLYSAVRFAEAIGLWLERRWAEWFGLLTAGMYIPAELYELSQGTNWAKVVVFIVNAGVVAYLAHVLYWDRKRRLRAGK